MDLFDWCTRRVTPDQFAISNIRCYRSMVQFCDR